MFKRLKKAKLNKPLPFVKLIPNFITISALCIGVSSLRFALESRWENAVLCIVIAAFLDGVDGRIARLLGATSHFGAELDSLCDFVNFGVAPSVIMYCWALQYSDHKVFAWSVVLLFILCMAIRLARFNTALLDPNAKAFSKMFFMGVPAPLGALLLLTPIMIDFDISDHLNMDFNAKSSSMFLAAYQLVVALLLPSRIPTFSFKNLVINPEYLWVCMFVVGLIIINMIIYPWYIFPILAVIYISTIPFSIAAAKKIRGE
ncbi:MAG: phosphatidylcholine/phosphatidylserine synthase [Rickettsiaceae bacterium]|nr:phosphatidylcholine/phosphatidylserine synthase [Rickettsiaceae bacterium]